ncbi:MAG: DUF475 domain-containing protein [Candidatus Saccharimonadales bacterium]
MINLLKHYWAELSVTLIAWILVGYYLGFEAFLMTVILSMLEISLSADNAVVNSRVLMKMSLVWQRLFLTVGIIFAVFIVRFILPIIMVAVTTSLGVGEVVSLALNNPDAYGYKLHEVAPIINGFGGFFLLMVTIFFFLDKDRELDGLWLKNIESVGLKLSKVPHVKTLIVAVIYSGLIWALPADVRMTVGVAMAFGIGLYVLLHGLTSIMEYFGEGDKGKKVKHVTGWAAFALFVYLQVLDASFSLDGVVGAFALTNNIVIIMAGLGIGALWVRAMTIYMVRHKTLTTYKFIESGAHWAIIALATIMILKIFHIELPELFVGTVGLICVGAAMYSSVRINRRKKLHG